MNNQNTAINISPDASRFDIEKIRADFPILNQQIHGKPLVYLDNAATSQKPTQVIDVLDTYYRETNSNIHRGVHSLSEKATAEYESARNKVKEFINAESTQEIVFVHGTTEAINLVAQSFGRSSQTMKSLSVNSNITLILCPGK